MKKFLQGFLLVMLTATLIVPFAALAAVHSWSLRPSPSSSVNTCIENVASDDDGTNLIISVSSERLYTSSDGGANWTERQPAGATNAVWRVSSDADGSNLIVGRTNNAGRLYTSSDGGANWTERQPAGNVNITWNSVASDSDGTNLIVGAVVGRLYTSSDGGATWTERQPAGASDIIWEVASDADGSNLIVSAQNGAVYTSSNGGANWTQRAPGGFAFGGWKISSDDDGSNLIAARSDGRLYTSSDGGANWTERQPAGAIDAIWRVASDADGSSLTVSMGVTGLSGAIYTSDDSGATWTEEFPTLNNDSSSWFVVASDADGSNLLASGSVLSVCRFFTAPNNTSPAYVLLNPDPGNAGLLVDINPTFTVTFDEDIATSTGNITIKKSSDNSTVEVIAATSALVSVSGPALAINPATTLDPGTDYYILIDSNAVEDLLGNPFAGINDTTWTFTTDGPPVPSSFSPSDDAAGVSLSGNTFGISFNENVTAASGNITLKKASDDSTVESFDVTDGGAVNVSGSEVSITQSVNLDFSTGYYFLIDPGAFEDGVADPFVGIADETTWNFTTSDLAALEFERVSVDSAGVEADNSSSAPSISFDGRYVAFSSGATNLVAGDTNGVIDIFVYDRTGDTIERVSVDSAGVEADNESGNPDISSDGRYVALASPATNLVAGDTNGFIDIFVYDRTGDTIERVSVDSAGVEADNSSGAPSISSDGRYVAFSSGATNLVAGDTNGVTDIFVYDRTDDTIERVSVDSAGVEADNESGNPDISSDGRYVAFISSATNLVAGDTNGVTDTFVYDRTGDTIERVSVDSAGVEADNSSSAPSISSDGRYVAFTSSATNLTNDVVDGSGAVFLRDTQAGTTVLIATGEGGGTTSAFSGAISGNGRYVTYVFYEYDEITGLETQAIYRYDTQTDTLLYVTDGAESDNSSDPKLSNDGLILTFISDTTNLITGDNNSVSDVFVYEEIPAVAEEPIDDDDDSGRRSSRDGLTTTPTPPTSPAQVLASLVSRLRLMIQEFVAQGGTPSPEMLAFLNGTPSSGYTYTRNLTLGDTGADVTALQNFLIRQNKGPAAAALAKIGATGYFGPLTQSALAEFQASVGISPAAGFFGPVTRAYVNAHP